MKDILESLFNGDTLSDQTAHKALYQLTEGLANDAQIAAFMTVFLMREITLEELRGFQKALLEMAIPLDFQHHDFIDVCGTGGDGKNTFNISTISAFVLAGAGYPVVKHGNYGVSSICGSSNVMEELGYRFKPSLDELKKEFDENGICFLHAPLFHPALKKVGPIRKALGVKTFFNMLGPLVNPAQPNYQLSGTFSLSLAQRYHYLLQEQRKGHCVVFDLAGYDEISNTAKSKLFTTKGEELYEPQETLVERDLFGGNNIKEAADLFIKILSGKGTPAQNKVILSNVSAGIKCFSPDKSWEDAQAEAQESLSSLKAYHILKNIIQNAA